MLYKTMISIYERGYRKKTIFDAFRNLNTDSGEQMDTKSPVFEKTYQDYLAKINGQDLETIARKTDTEWTGDSVIVPLFGRPYRVSGKGILDPSGKKPQYSTNVVLCQYLLLHPSNHSEDDNWVSYKDFRDAAPLAHTFQVNTEMSITRTFTGKRKALEEACLNLGGYAHSSEWDYDLHMKFDALPRVPMLLLFNDADDEFPAQSLLLFEERAAYYLDMECLAILGWLLAEKLHPVDLTI